MRRSTILNADTMWIDGVRSNLGRLAEAFDPARMDILLTDGADHLKHRL